MVAWSISGGGERSGVYMMWLVEMVVLFSSLANHSKQLVVPPQALKYKKMQLLQHIHHFWSDLTVDSRLQVKMNFLNTTRNNSAEQEEPKYHQDLSKLLTTSLLPHVFKLKNGNAHYLLFLSFFLASYFWKKFYCLTFLQHHECT